MSIDPIYRNIHDRVDSDLISLQGLLCAMDSVVQLHPKLSGPDLQTQALHSILGALQEKVELAMEAQSRAWVEMGGQK